MVYFLIGVPKIQGKAETSIERVNTSLGTSGKLYRVDMEYQKFKLGNFDNMMVNYETVGKIENSVENVIKRILKAYNDVDPKAVIANLVVDSKDLGPVTVDKFLTKFSWDDSKYPRNQQLVDLLKIISQRITTVDNNLKSKIQAFVDSKNASSQGSKKDALQTRNLNELFYDSKVIKPSDFVNTKHFKTMIAIVPDSEVQKFLAGYEAINEFIIPGSAKELPVSQDIGAFKLFRFVLLAKQSDDVVAGFRTHMKISVRSFEYDSEEILRREALKKTAADKTQSDSELLRKTCLESFKDIFSTYAHLKFLKVVIDAQMRFGSPEDYVVLNVDVQKGKEKKVHKGIIECFAERGKRDFYGTKDEINDSEDFFPYAFALIDQP